TGPKSRATRPCRRSSPNLSDPSRSTTARGPVPGLVFRAAQPETPLPAPFVLARANTAHRKTHQPFTIPVTHPLPQPQRFGQVAPRRHIPHHNDALHRPHPRHYLLHTLLTPVLRRFNLQHLFARPEQDLNGPAPGELHNDPARLRRRVRRE